MDFHQIFLHFGLSLLCLLQRGQSSLDILVFKLFLLFFTLIFCNCYRIEVLFVLLLLLLVCPLHPAQVSLLFKQKWILLYQHLFLVEFTLVDFCEGGWLLDRFWLKLLICIKRIRTSPVQHVVHSCGVTGRRPLLGVIPLGASIAYSDLVSEARLWDVVWVLCRASSWLGYVTVY